MTLCQAPRTPTGTVGEINRPSIAARQRLVLVCHGALADGTGLAVPRDLTQWGIGSQHIAQHGYSAAATDHGYASWGNDSALDAAEAMVALCTSGAWAPPAGDSGRVALVGISMGMLTATRYALAHPDRIAALIGIVPVCNLGDFYTRNTGLRDQICTAHGVATPGPGTLPAPISTATDPTSHITEYQALIAAGVPVEVWSSIGDTTVDVDPDPHIVADWAALVGARHRIIQSGGHSGTGAPLGALYLDVLGRGRWS